MSAPPHQKKNSQNLKELVRNTQIERKKNKNREIQESHEKDKGTNKERKGKNRDKIKIS